MYRPHKELDSIARNLLERALTKYNIEDIDIHTEEPSITLTNGTIIYIEGVEQ